MTTALANGITTSPIPRNAPVRARRQTVSITESWKVSRVVEKEVVKVQKTPDVQALEDSHKRIVAEYGRLADRLRELANRPLPKPQVVKVEVEVPGLKPTTEQCVELRAEFRAAYNQWGSRSEEIALDAINAGCW